MTPLQETSIQTAAPGLLQWHSEGNISRLWLPIGITWRPGEKKILGPADKEMSLTFLGEELSIFCCCCWGECEFFKVPQVILFSLTTLSSVWDTSSQMREQTLVTPLHLSAVEA